MAALITQVVRVRKAWRFSGIQMVYVAGFVEDSTKEMVLFLIAGDIIVGPIHFNSQTYSIVETLIWVKTRWIK